ncbi:SDR family oxidoreductase [Amantichitinum ursilacus]|uniref:Quinone oxidoreductase 2 n=1 Tax=Amantichitinum ursilacus TaxID=857265 RepID=A0A0N0GLM4_9NEIS|nr:SDR family oxidoreductase [Amantichitinum ursilacus]KPC50248.1 Quinone oxidoreductase 2 [Amantichitinum ursilacus]
MSATQQRILVTGASGQLGRLTIAELLKRVPASQIIALVRKPEAAEDFKAQGVETRIGDYTDSASLEKAFAGVDRVLLISSNELGQRATQHKNVVNAAKAAGVKLVAYTSVLHADTSLLGLAEEHRQTEAALKASGVPYVFLRNGWYLENQVGGAANAVAHGAVLGVAGEGKISAAARADYAAAAAVVLTSSDDQAGKVYELAGDSSYTGPQLAAEIARQSGKPVNYVHLDEAGYKKALIDVGLPEVVADLLADSDNGASKNTLFNEDKQLSKLIGRPTATLSDAVAAALGQ